jgi:ATP-dependent Clp protease ATP-binding subunit ClpA
MADRFDKFTERARKVLHLAQEEAQRFNHNYIGTEHLLLGLIREGEGVAAKVLSNLGVELNKVRSAVEFIIGRRDRAVRGEVGLTPRSKKVIELSVDEARRLGHHYIGTEHLLLGLVREGEGVAAGVLQSRGVSLDKVRSQILYVLDQTESYASAKRPAPSGPQRPRAPFERFAERARLAFRHAQQEAEDLGHPAVGAEHLLLGVLYEQHGAAARMFAGLGVGLDQVRAEVVRVRGRGNQLDDGAVSLSKQAKQVIELAVQEAQALRHERVETEHLLLGLAGEQNALAQFARANPEQSPEAVREAILALRSGDLGLEQPRWGRLSALLSATLTGLEAAPGKPFTTRARLVFAHAYEEARRFNHNYIGTEHLLLGLIREEEGVGARALRSLNVELGKVRSAVELIVGRGGPAATGEIELTLKARRVVTLATEEATRLGHDQAGPSTCCWAWSAREKASRPAC